MAIVESSPVPAIRPENCAETRRQTIVYTFDKGDELSGAIKYLKKLDLDESVQQIIVTINTEPFHKNTVLIEPVYKPNRP